MRGHPLISIVAALCALVCSQVPEFMQQYYQRLGGAVEEVGRIVRQFTEDSSRSGYERSAALRVMANNSERLVRDQATRMQENITRFDRLRGQQEVMRDSDALARFTAFLMDFDQPLAKKTYDAYRLALSVEGAFFAAFGFLISWLVLFVVTAPFRSRSRDAEA